MLQIIFQDFQVVKKYDKKAPVSTVGATFKGRGLQLLR